MPSEEVPIILKMLPINAAIQKMMTDSGPLFLSNSIPGTTTVRSPTQKIVEGHFRMSLYSRRMAKVIAMSHLTMKMIFRGHHNQGMLISIPM